MISIRRELMLTLALALLALFAVAGMVFHQAAQRALTAQFDENLLARAHLFANLTEVEGDGRSEFEFAELPLLEYRPGPNANYFQVWDVTGASIVRSHSLEGGDLALSELPVANPSVQDIELPDGRRGRAAVLRYTVPVPRQAASPPDFILVVARGRAELDQALGWLHRALLILGGTVALGSVVIAWLSLRRGLRPLVAIGAEAQAVDPDRPSQRFTVEGRPRELQPICAQLNAMLAKLESAIDRERRVSANMAHELRTPIAELRTIAEVGLVACGQGEGNGDVAASFADALQVARQMETLVHALLTLYRCQTNQIESRTESIDIRALIDETWAAHAEEASNRLLVCELECPPASRWMTDRGLLAAILHNLFANAVEHTPRGGSIRCEVEPVDGGEALHLSNTAEGLEPEDMIHVFEPLWRKDASRTDKAHAGLGLTLVAAYAEILRLGLQVDMPQAGLFRVSLWAVPHAHGAPPATRTAAPVLGRPASRPRPQEGLLR